MAELQEAVVTPSSEYVLINYLQKSLQLFPVRRANRNFDSFREPRGVIRILQLVVAIWSFFECYGFSVTLNMDCNANIYNRRYLIEFPFGFSEEICRRRINNDILRITLESSSGAIFFALTAALSILYVLVIILVYTWVKNMLLLVTKLCITFSYVGTVMLFIRPKLSSLKL